jgi:putative transposase
LACSRVIDAGGIQAYSRWSRSEATTTTGKSAIHDPHPGGVPAVPSMPSSHTSLLYHLIFATKNREPSIAEEWRSRLHEYLGGTVRGLGGTSQGVGGVADHVHLLVGLKATHRLADFMRELKGDSSKWVRSSFPRIRFAWQGGYAAFSVSPSAAPSVREYIARQAEHHRHRTFREELIEFLRKSGVEYDERYLD